MNKILSRYKVEITTPVNYPLYNKITTVDDTMSQVIGDHYTNYDANALLSGANSVLNDLGIDEVFFHTQSLQLAIVTKLTTYLYVDSDVYDEDNSITPSYSLPTQHFQVIVEAWRNHLANSPTTP